MLRNKRCALASYTLMGLLLCGCLQICLGADEIDNASARAFNAAAALQNAGLHVRAATKWSEFITSFPQDERIGRAHYYLGVCRLREKKFHDAIESFQTVLTRWPNLEQADKAQYNLAMTRYEIAHEADNKDAFRQAAKDFEQLVAKHSASEFVDDALYYLADCLFNAGDVAAAVPTYEKLIAKHPNSPQAARAYYDLGIAQQQLGKLPEAAQTYRTFLEKREYASHELTAEIRLRLAICLYAVGQLDQAADQFDKVSQISGFELASYAALRLGQTQLDQGKHDQAAGLLNAFAKRFPNSEYRADAAKTAGQCYYLADKPQDAVRVLSPVANSKDPPAAEAAYWLGRSQLKLGQADQALKTLEKAIGRFKDHPFAVNIAFARIDALYQLPKRRHETPALYENFLRENPNHAFAPQAAYMTALSSFGQLQYRKSREVAETYLAKPGNASTAFAADMKYIAAESYLLESPGDADARNKAEVLYRELVEKYPGHARAATSHLRIGWCLHSAEKYQDAINFLQACLGKLDKNQLPEAHLLIGRSHAKLNQHREAITSLSAAISANKDWERIDEVLLAAAESHRELNELDQTADFLRRLVNDHRSSQWRSQAMYWLAEIAQHREQHDEAINWFKQVAEQFPDSEFGGPAIHALAAVHLAKQQYPQARDWASRLVDGKFSDELKQRARYIRGLAYQREHEFQKAISDLSAYRQKPVDEDEATNATYALALCHIGQQKFDAARNVLDELVKATPEFPHADTAFYELGHGLLSQKDKAAEAAAAFLWIANNRGDSDLAAESWFRVAQHQSELASQIDDAGKKRAAYQTAEASLKQGLEKAGGGDLSEHMQYLLGDLQFQQQRFTDAADTFAKQIHEFPSGKYTGPATFLAAQSRYQLQQFDQALPLFIKIADIAFADTQQQQIESYRSQALYRAGDCAAKLKRWQESHTHFQKLVDQYPQFPQRSEALLGAAYALQEQDQLDRAIQLYDQVTKQTETETAAQSRFMVGEIEFGRKRYEDAIEQFLLVTVGYPYESWQALARFETARCFIELGDEDRAVLTLREMIEKHPDHPRTSDAKKMLEDRNK